MARFDLTDFEWAVIEPLLPNKPRGVPRVDDRRVLNGIFRRLRTGAPWADIPERYGPHTTSVNRFNRWLKAGVWGSLSRFVGPTGVSGAPAGRLTRKNAQHSGWVGGNSHAQTHSSPPRLSRFHLTFDRCCRQESARRDVGVSSFDMMTFVGDSLDRWTLGSRSTDRVRSGSDQVDRNVDVAACGF
jgi:hypothetical protein